MALLPDKISIQQFLAEGISLYQQGKIDKTRLIEGLRYVYAKHYGVHAHDKELQQLYTSIEQLIKPLTNSYKEGEAYHIRYNSDYVKSHIKYDDTPKYNEYYFLQIDEIPTEGDTDMQGVDYIKSTNPARKYSHMRRMLQTLWEITRVPSYNKFEIDSEFMLDCDNLANHMFGKYYPEQINEAHYRVRTEYKGRGRPSGAKNKSTIFGKRNNSNVIPDALVMDMPDDVDNMTNEQLVDELKEEPKTGQMLDSSKFVQHYQLSDRVAPLENSVRNLKSNQDAIEAWGRGIDTRIEALEQAKPTIIELKRADDMPNIQMGIQHFNFEKLVKMLNTRLPSGYPIIPWVYGPAGTGKTTACDFAAKAFNTEFRTMGTTLAKFEILGFVNTTGYQTTPFREAYENGYLFCADEIDSWAKEATVAINGALANGVCNFADKMVKRHPDFRMVACANTLGQGATMDYVGRNKQDAATLDRFVYLNWPLDEALEDNLCANKAWLAYVRHVRARAATSGINPKPMITPRASMAGASLLNSGHDWDDVVEMCLRKGMSDPQWNQIK